MNRKGFLKSTSLFMGGAIVTSTLNAKLFSSDINTLNLKKSLGFGMIGEKNLSLEDKLKLVKDIGFDGVEFNSPVEFSLKSIIRAKDKAGIKTPSTIIKTIGPSHFPIPILPSGSLLLTRWHVPLKRPKKWEVIRFLLFPVWSVKKYPMHRLTRTRWNQYAS